jgi:hypothetical protein
MNTRSAREYIMFAPAQLLRNWPEQRPSNKGDLDSSLGGGGGYGVFYTAVDLLLVSFSYHSTELLLGCVLNCTLCISLTEVVRDMNSAVHSMRTEFTNPLQTKSLVIINKLNLYLLVHNDDCCCNVNTWLNEKLNMFKSCLFLQQKCSHPNSSFPFAQVLITGELMIRLSKENNNVTQWQTYIHYILLLPAYCEHMTSTQYNNSTEQTNKRHMNNVITAHSIVAEQGARSKHVPTIFTKGT